MMDINMEEDLMDPCERFRELVISSFVEVDRVVTIAGNFEDGGWITYRVELEALERLLTVDYSVGPGTTFSGYSGPDEWAMRHPWSRSVDAVNARKRIRAEFRPDAVDVVRLVLLDIATADRCADWAEWVIAMGPKLFRAEDIRNAEDSFRTIRTRFRPWAEQVFGPDLPEAIELAGAL